MLSQIVLDFKDVKSDKKEALLTAAVYFGKKNTMNILGLGRFVIPLVFFLLVLLFNLNEGFYLLIILSFIINSLIIKKISENKVSGYLFSAAKFFIWFVVTFTAKMFIV
jgi:4-hydroxybenzoate polyprenyltransferase